MKKYKIIGLILFWLSIISLPLSFALTSKIGETDIFGVDGIVRYSWIMLLFSPICILSFVFGIYLKRKKQKYKANYIVAFIFLPLLLIFGSYRFIFDNITYDMNKIHYVEEKTDIDFPDKLKVTTHDLGNYTLSHAKITNQQEKTAFLSNAKESNSWTTKLSPEIIVLLPFDIQMQTSTFDYFAVYNVTSDSPQISPSPTETQEIIFAAYDNELEYFVILSDYMITAK